MNKPKDGKKDKKVKKKDKDNKNKKNKKKKLVVNENASIRISTSSTGSSNNDPLYPPFVPTKRIIEHHEYQNIIDEAAITNAEIIQKMPALRRFGDTNILKNKKDFNNLNHKRLSNNKQNISNKTTFAEQSNGSNSESHIRNHSNQSTDSSFLNSLDSVESNSYFPSKYFNIELKSPSKSQFNYKYSAGSGSNLSGGSTISDSNSLDSMEHEIIHRKPTANAGNGADSNLSYLGPFNFRQLLRPTQGPTESLRKRRGLNLSSTPPPLQKGKTKV